MPVIVFRCLNLINILCSGYMSPEYAIDGKFSVKSDVFGLGVLLLEIVSGQKNRNFRHPDHHHTLLGHVGVHTKQQSFFSFFFSLAVL